MSRSTALIRSSSSEVRTVVAPRACVGVHHLNDTVRMCDAIDGAAVRGSDPAVSDSFNR